MNNILFEHPANHYMVDIETLGRNNAPIIEIGVIQFNIHTGDYIGILSDVIDLRSCLDYGLKIDPATLKWWLNTDPKKLREILSDPNAVPLENALNRFKNYFSRNTSCGKYFV